MTHGPCLQLLLAYSGPSMLCQCVTCSIVWQGDRYSIAYFANARESTVFQGPLKKYPPITFPEVTFLFPGPMSVAFQMHLISLRYGLWSCQLPGPFMLQLDRLRDKHMRCVFQALAF